MAEGRYTNKAPTRGGKPGEARRGGRKVGTPNKMTKAIKEMIVEALDEAGGVKYLVKQSSENPVAFMGLVGKVLPLQITGADGGAIEIRAVERRIVPIEPLKLVSNASG